MPSSDVTRLTVDGVKKPRRLRARRSLNSTTAEDGTRPRIRAWAFPNWVANAPDDAGPLSDAVGELVEGHLPFVCTSTGMAPLRILR